MKTQSVKTLRDTLQVEEPIAPLVIKALVPTNQNFLTQFGPTTNSKKIYNYVCVDLLPEGMQEQIRTAIEMLLRP